MTETDTEICALMNRISSLVRQRDKIRRQAPPIEDCVKLLERHCHALAPRTQWELSLKQLVSNLTEAYKGMAQSLNGGEDE